MSPVLDCSLETKGEFADVPASVAITSIFKGTIIDLTVPGEVPLWFDAFKIQKFLASVVRSISQAIGYDT